MNSMGSQRSAFSARGWVPAGIGLLLASVGGLSLAQAGGSDTEFFLTVGYFLCATGLLGIVIGGVAIGIQLARD